MRPRSSARRAHGRGRQLVALGLHAGQQLRSLALAVGLEDRALELGRRVVPVPRRPLGDRLLVEAGGLAPALVVVARDAPARRPRCARRARARRRSAGRRRSRWSGPPRWSRAAPSSARALTERGQRDHQRDRCTTHAASHETRRSTGRARTTREPSLTSGRCHSNRATMTPLRPRGWGGPLCCAIVLCACRASVPAPAAGTARRRGAGDGSAVALAVRIHGHRLRRVGADHGARRRRALRVGRHGARPAALEGRGQERRRRGRRRRRADRRRERPARPPRRRAGRRRRSRRSGSRPRPASAASPTRAGTCTTIGSDRCTRDHAAGAPRGRRRRLGGRRRAAFIATTGTAGSRSIFCATSR